MKRKFNPKRQSEFAGGAGLIQPEQKSHLSPNQELEIIKASDPTNPRKPRVEDVGKLRPNGWGSDETA